MSRKEFSIVIPVYNRAKVLGGTLESVLRQSYRPLHVILADNASTDNSPLIMADWKRKHEDPGLCITVVEERTPGAAAARNRGLREVGSEFMLFFDSDDLMHPEAVNAYMQAFESGQAPDIVMSRSRSVDSITGQGGILPLRGGDRLLAQIHHSTLRTQGYAIRTSLVRRVGGWDESTRIWDDWELGIRLLLATDKIAQIPDVACTIVTSAESITGARYSDSAGLYEAPLQAAERVLAGCVRPDAERLAAMMDYRRIMLAAHYAREGATDKAAALKTRVLKKADSSYPLRRRLLLRLAYLYIRHGLRGFDRLITRFF